MLKIFKIIIIWLFLKKKFLEFQNEVGRTRIDFLGPRRTWNEKEFLTKLNLPEPNSKPKVSNRRPARPDNYRSKINYRLDAFLLIGE